MAKSMRFYLTRDKGECPTINAFRLSEQPRLDNGGWWRSKAGTDGEDLCPDGAKFVLGRLRRKGTKVLVTMTWEQVK